MRETNSGKPITNPETSSVPTDDKLPDGQYADHWVLSEEERSKDFIRPLRLSYTHVGLHPTGTLRNLRADEKEAYGDRFVKYEQYPTRGDGKVLGRYWTQEQLDNRGCGGHTKMGLAIAETYAKNPSYYGRTFCCHCGDYFPVGSEGEFVWEGTNERVGS